MSIRDRNNLDVILKDYESFKLNLNKTNIGIIPLYVCVGGSRSYGTFNESSDTDIRGVFISDINNYLGFNSKVEQVEILRTDSNEKDTLMELKKFLKLATSNNPNVIEMLFVKEEHMLYVHPWFQVFIDNRDLFLSKRCKHSYSGYAFSQLKRIQGHYDFLTNSIIKPKQEDYMIIRYMHKETKTIIPESDYLSKEKRIKAIANSGEVNSEDKNSFFEDLNLWDKIEVLNKNPWDKALDKYKQYKSWRENRNKERASIEEKYGYDLKHASHLVRLLLQGKQILKEKSLNTYLREDDMQIFNDIKFGKYSYPELIQFADSMNKELEELYLTSDLRNTPVVKDIDQLCVNLLQNFIIESRSK